MTAQILESLSWQEPSGDRADYLVVILHGWGADYRDLMPVANLLQLTNCRYLFPNAPFPHFQMPTGRAWYALEREDFMGLEVSRDRLYRWLKFLPEHTGIPPERTAMVGFSQGGAMTLDVGLDFGLAALCIMSGYLHFDPAGRQGPFAPTLLIHGTQDPVVPLQAAEHTKEKLAALGVPLSYQEFEGGHEIPPVAVNTLRTFLQTHLFT